MMEIWQKGVAELGADFRAGRLDPVAVLEVCLARIARIDPLLNAIVTLDASGARRDARRAPLAGKPARRAPASTASR